ncbi:hypothetical protein GCM10009758_07190 [Microbacterium hatanonis]
MLAVVGERVEVGLRAGNVLLLCGLTHGLFSSGERCGVILSDTLDIDTLWRRRLRHPGVLPPGGMRYRSPETVFMSPIWGTN